MSAHSDVSGQTNPNIILIVADDLGWSDLGCYGGEIATPHLDRLANRGIRFTQMHNTAKCFPSRACLLTGLYSQQAGMTGPNAKFQNATTLAAVLKETGYKTIAVGKHHGTDNLHDIGFDHYWGLRDGASNYFNPGLQRKGEPKPAQKRSRTWCFDDKVINPYTPKDPNFYTTDAYTDWAIDFLDRYKEDPAPFFLYLAYQAPHDPLHAWPEDIEKYEGRYDEGFEVIAEARYQKQLELGLIDDRHLRSIPTHREWHRLSEAEKKDQTRRMEVYAAMIDRLDQNIGRLIKKIDALGEMQNTLILFVSDNGASAEIVEIGNGPIGSIDRWSSLKADWANVCNTPLRLYKNYSHQGGINTPMIAHWPNGIQNPGRFSDYVGHFIDFMPTLIELTNAKYPNEYQGHSTIPMQGQSFLPVFHNREVTRNAPLYWQWQRGKAVRQGKWKWVKWGQQTQLFNLKTDRSETQNQIHHYPEIAQKLEKMHANWEKSVGIGKK
ncbi:MAG: arylsulfatase [Opitutales bacterium]|nr:arylsulfatase [Opitutales bacterium]